MTERLCTIIRIGRNNCKSCQLKKVLSTLDNIYLASSILSALLLPAKDGALTLGGSSSGLDAVEEFVVELLVVVGVFVVVAGPANVLVEGGGDARAETAAVTAAGRLGVRSCTRGRAVEALMLVAAALLLLLLLLPVLLPAFAATALAAFAAAMAAACCCNDAVKSCIMAIVAGDKTPGGGGGMGLFAAVAVLTESDGAVVAVVVVVDGLAVLLPSAAVDKALADADGAVEPVESLGACFCFLFVAIPPPPSFLRFCRFDSALVLLLVVVVVDAAAPAPLPPPRLLMLVPTGPVSTCHSFKAVTYTGSRIISG